MYNMVVIHTVILHPGVYTDLDENPLYWTVSRIQVYGKREGGKVTNSRQEYSLRRIYKELEAEARRNDRGFWGFEEHQQ